MGFSSGLLALSPARAGQSRVGAGGKEVYTGTAIAIGGQFSGRSRTFTLQITGYTPEAEAARYYQILREGGQDALMKAIEENRLGNFAFDGEVGRDLNFIRLDETEEGRKLTILFARWLNIFEVRRGSRSQDYPFSYIELYLDEKGKGEGSLIGLARVRFDKKNPNALDVENFGAFPAKLMGVQRRGK
jgi:hypothetical protein